MSALPAKHLFTNQEWQRLGTAQFFPAEVRSELMEGEIIERSPIGPTHRSCVDYLNHFLVKRLPETARLSVQNPITLGNLSEPQPDLVLMRFRSDYYREAHPGPEDIWLVIEVADTSLDYDRDTKGPLYARFALPEYWIVNLPQRCVEIYRAPRGRRYENRQIVSGETRIHPLSLPEVGIRVGSIFM